ncbi:hypothetical protein I350_03247 [Cryptococcus amylolentus CBS 6273]|uniref:Uncharacterized protein n=1 Tax=Cryptococcus amylolentus CBS 6273 TaxID=1296118 RepID=A0A1E3K472_9TREE|nr:hypothetical protein I350_03247 [Cryptococcus amylolentus CBS 6273]
MPEQDTRNDFSLEAADTGGIEFRDPSAEALISNVLADPELAYIFDENYRFELPEGQSAPDDGGEGQQQTSPEHDGDQIPQQRLIISRRSTKVDRWLHQLQLTDGGEGGGEETERDDRRAEQNMVILRMRPASGPDWISEASKRNRDIFIQYQGSEEKTVPLSQVSAVVFYHLNDRAALASEVFDHAIEELNTDVSDAMRQTAIKNTKEYADSIHAIQMEGLGIERLDESYDAFRVRTVLISTDLNKGTAQDIQDGSTGTVLPESLLRAVRSCNTAIRQTYDVENWREAVNEEFQELVNEWSDSLEVLRETGMTGLPTSLE